MTERADYQERIAESRTPNVFDIDFESLPEPEILRIRAERFASYATFYDSQNDEDKKRLDIELEKKGIV